MVKHQTRCDLRMIGAWLIACCLLIPCLASGARAEDDLVNVWTTDAGEIRREIEQVAARPGGAAALEFADGPIYLWVNRCFIGTDDAYSGHGTRYVVVRLTVVNTGPTELQLAKENIQLLVGGKEFTNGDDQGLFRDIPLEIDWHPNGNVRPRSQLRTPDEITIPAGKAVTVWSVFAGLDPVPPIPQMTLQATFDSGEIRKLDLNAQQNARLGLTSQGIGPDGTLTLFTIHGQLNRVNSALLAQELRKVAEQGGTRFLVEWGPKSKPSDDVLYGWLLSAGGSLTRDNQLYLQLPLLPDAHLIILSQIPEANHDVKEWDETRDLIFDNSRDAVQFALEEIFERLPPSILLREIRRGHPWSRTAALRSASHRLGAEGVPLLLELSTNEDPQLRRAAIMALGQLATPAADQKLSELVRSSDPGDVETAFAALLKVPTPDRRERVLALLRDDRLEIPRERVLQLLVEDYHPAWDSYLEESVRDSRSDVRRHALQVLHEIGHVRLTELCVTALSDPEESVREQAFQILIQTKDRSAQQAAIDYALQRLKEGKVEASILDLVERVRETRAAPCLLERILEESPMRPRIIEVIGHIGTDEHLQDVLSNLQQFDEEEQVAALELLRGLAVDRQLEIAREVSRSSSTSVRFKILEILKGIGTGPALDVIDLMFQNREQRNDLDVICISLGEIGSDDAIKRLHAYREQAVAEKDDDLLRAVDQGLRVWKLRLPGYNFVQTGNAYVQANDDQEAIKAYSLALLINPDLADAYSARGNIYLRLKEFDKAGADFEQALKLDSYDGQAVTGVAIVKAVSGKWEESVELVDSHANRFPRDYIYAYNTACVYSRCVEALKKQEPSETRDQRIAEFQQRAISKLEEAISEGFDQFAWMQEDPDLEPIRSLPAFGQLKPVD